MSADDDDDGLLYAAFGRLGPVCRLDVGRRIPDLFVKQVDAATGQSCKGLFLRNSPNLGGPKLATVPIWLAPLPALSR